MNKPQKAFTESVPSCTFVDLFTKNHFLKDAFLYGTKSLIFIPGRREGSSSSNSSSSVVVAVGSFFGGVVATVLIFLLIYFIKRRNNRKNRIHDLPMTVRDGTTSGQAVAGHSKNHNTKRQERDENVSTGQMLSMCLPCTSCM